jgi:hypothetical protein
MLRPEQKRPWVAKAVDASIKTYFTLLTSTVESGLLWRASRHRLAFFCDNINRF